ncbi:MAG: c-type cytochrome [Chitinophagaceae bacterium]|nr:c-type cytochrome [Chitinophagaceae bacterium]MCW5927733.1 c-type cytochrome [Chitinophagaceae bacterium]
MLQTNKKKFFVGLALCSILLIGVAATTADQPKRNLKVLPKNISHEDLERIMKEFNVSLGVKCNFCHAPSKTSPGKLDFQSDENSKKDVARSMLKLTSKINKKYFGHDVKKGGDEPITCITCHNGKQSPESKIELPPPPQR